MKKGLPRIAGLALLAALNACKKNNSDVNPVSASQTVAITPIATLGLYEYASGTNKRIFLPVTKVGTQSVTYYTIFDTGSTGLTLDANGILPASMITSSGITVTGDSVVVNGITVTSKTSVMSYGDQTSLTKEYGNLAYATITLGDQTGNITTRRIPFFLYWKIQNVTTGVVAVAHSADVFGVGPGTSYAFSAIASPLSYFTTATGQTSGFKLATLGTTGFTSTGTYVGGLLTIGLINSDYSSGFIMHPLTYNATAGYLSNIPATITYGSQSTSAQVLFDTGTPSVTIIEDKTATVGALPVNTKVTVTTNKGFVYTYTTSSTANLTSVENPNITGDYRTIFSLDFFVTNEYLLDYTNHQIGLKNN
ncbi:hypothetical protein BEL04_07820 [Mucilaginibacter sp. PPCGB 2223]|uniref:hypothetical protein n=1 Tax=Mucilaginibacter sp. PPCGB 2223 TaxID=1886027 RepID=UPI000826FC26|nr:hypothetical protein [Mucilaginibacter sp. PPCGB 2223]OCX54165.1 hypothetical protein BEL04_07820 [Mucilaginibacter sp. PPCGB 2223]